MLRRLKAARWAIARGVSWAWLYFLVARDFVNAVMVTRQYGWGVLDGLFLVYALAKVVQSVMEIFDCE